MDAKDFKAARAKLGLTQTEIGVRLGGYSLRAVQSWESGERGIPPAVRVLIELMLKLA